MGEDLIVECVDPRTYDKPHWALEKPLGVWKKQYFGLAYDIIDTPFLDELFRVEHNPEIQKYLPAIDLEFILNAGDEDLIGKSEKEIDDLRKKGYYRNIRAPQSYSTEKITDSMNQFAEILKKKDLPSYYWLEIEGKRNDYNSWDILWKNSLASLEGTIGKVSLHVYQRDIDYLGSNLFGEGEYEEDVTKEKEMEVTLVERYQDEKNGKKIWKRRIGKTVEVKFVPERQYEHFKWLLDKFLKIAFFAK